MGDDFLSGEIARFNWRKLDPVSSTVFCHCGGEWRGHAKSFMLYDRFATVPEHPCPKCGRRDTVKRVSFDPEKYTIGGDDEQDR